MAKLTDTQLVILSAATQREGGAVLPLPKSLKTKGAAVTKSLEGLRKKGLIEEKPAAADIEAWRKDEDGRRMMLAITDAGLQAIDGGPDGGTRKKSASKKPQPKKRRGRPASKPSAAKSKNKQSPPAVRQCTKQALLIDLLKRKNGASIDEIVKAIGWRRRTWCAAPSAAR